MELWIRSTARTNLLKARFLTIMKGKKFYKKDEWEFEGYTICNCTEQGNYELLGTYKTKERALKVLDEIQNILMPKCIINKKTMKFSKPYEENGIVLMDCNANARIEELSTYVYEMPED